MVEQLLPPLGLEELRQERGRPNDSHPNSSLPRGAVYGHGRIEGNHGRDGVLYAPVRPMRASCSTRQCLQPREWLNDEIINVYMQLLDARDKEVRGGCGLGGLALARSLRSVGPPWARFDRPRGTAAIVDWMGVS